MSNNVIEQAIRPEVPDVIPNQEFYVYVPKATTTTPGIVAFNANDFNIVDGVITIDTNKWGDMGYVNGKLVATARRIVRRPTNYSVSIDSDLQTVNIESLDSETLVDESVRSVPTTYNLPFKAGQGTTFVIDDNIVSIKSDVGVLGSVQTAEVFNNYDGNSGNQASGDRSHAEGFETSASGDASHAEGRGSGAAGYGSHAEGWSSAIGDYSHGEGRDCLAEADYSHAEGYDTKARGQGSHSEGYQTSAPGVGTHAEGYGTIAGSNANTVAAHAEGYETKALGHYSHAEGDSTIASGESQHVFGRFNIADRSNVEIVGWGTSSTRANIRTLSPTGNEWIAGKYTQEGTPTNDKDLTTKLYVDTITTSLNDEITSLKSIVGTGENYVGQLSGNSLPSESALNDYVQAQEGRTPQGGDTITFVLYVTGGQDKIYKYKYNGSVWSSFLIPAVEVSSNGELGVVKGTYGIDSTNDILVNIIDGEIKNIYAKDKDSNYTKLGITSSLTETVTSVVDGTTGYDVACDVTEKYVDDMSFQYSQVRNLPIAGGTGVSLLVDNNLVKINAEVTKSYVDTQDNAIKSYVDDKDTTINNRITDSNIRINNLERSVYGELSDWNDETFLALKDSILPSTITVDNSTYNIIDGTRALLSSVKGNTKQFNQLVQGGDISSSDYIHGYQGATYTIDSDNVLHVVANNGTSYGSNVWFNVIRNYVPGRSYILKIKAKWNTKNLYVRLSKTNNTETNNFNLGAGDNTVKTIALKVTDTVNLAIGNRLYIGYYTETTTEDTFDIYSIMLTDITAMGLSDITETEFVQKYPNLYYPTNAGTLYDSVVSGVSLTGKNLWDEQWEIGGLNYDNGLPFNQSTTIRSKNFITVLPNETLFFTANNKAKDIHFYNADKKQVSVSYQSSNNSFTIPNNCYFIKFMMQSSYGTTYNNDICINISDPSFNGQYEPYRLSTISLPSTETLGGVGTAQDEIQVTKNENDDYYTIKKIQRVASVDLGSLNWSQYVRPGSDYQIFYANIVDKQNRTENLNIICAKYSGATRNANNASDASTLMSNLQISGYYSSTSESSYVYIRDDSYSDSSSFKQSLNGIYATYELATPVETVITETATLAEVSAIRENGGMISVVGNTNEDYVQPDVSETILHSVTPNA